MAIHGLLVLGKEARMSYTDILRQRLARYVNRPFDLIVLSHDEIRRPICLSFPDIKMSRSHKTDCVFNAFTRNHLLGVDIEDTRIAVEHHEIAQTFFSEKESTLLAGESSCKQEQFFLLWTGKEAIAKAHQIPLVEALKIPLPASLVENKIHEYRWKQHAGCLFFKRVGFYQIAIACSYSSVEKEVSFFLEIIEPPQHNLMICCEVF